VLIFLFYLLEFVLNVVLLMLSIFQLILGLVYFSLDICEEKILVQAVDFWKIGLTFLGKLAILTAVC
jgi:hypothetical protein